MLTLVEHFFVDIYVAAAIYSTRGEGGYIILGIVYIIILVGCSMYRDKLVDREYLRMPEGLIPK